MIPRTAVQKEVALLALELPGLTLKQSILLRQHLFSESKEGYFYKGVARCTACGHVWNAPTNTVGQKMTCPCCGKVLDMTKCRKTAIKQSQLEYVTLTQTFKGWQVTRTFVLEKTMRTNERANYDLRCVQSCWDSTRGHVLFQSCKTMNFWWCRAGKGWSFYTEMKDDRSYYQMVPNIEVIEGILPELRKRGFSKRTKHYMYLQPLFHNLLTQPFFESYWKRKQYELAYRFVEKRWDKDVDRAITIFLRHRKSGWKDKNEMNDWFDMIECLQYLKKDLRSPAYICPENIKEAHDRWVKLRDRKRDEARRRQKYDEAIEKAKHQTKIAERYIKERGEPFKELCIHNDEIYIKVLPDVRAFIDEADEMQHCVCANEYYNLNTHPNSLIMSARLGEAWKERIETIEVNLETYRIIQSRGYKNNDTTKHNEIVDLVTKNMDLIRKYNRANN